MICDPATESRRLFSPTFRTYLDLMPRAGSAPLERSRPEFQHFVPPRQPRMEKTNRRSRDRIHGIDIRSLVSVTRYAGVREVVRGRIACVFPADYVV